MPTKKKRIVLALDDKYLKRLDLLKDKLNTKQYSKVIIKLLDIININ